MLQWMMWCWILMDEDHKIMVFKVSTDAMIDVVNAVEVDSADGDVVNDVEVDGADG